MIAYNELSQAMSNEILKDDDMFILENLELQEKVPYWVKIEDENFGLNDCSMDLRED